MALCDLDFNVNEVLGVEGEGRIYMVATLKVFICGPCLHDLSLSVHTRLGTLGYCFKQVGGLRVVPAFTLALTRAKTARGTGMRPYNLRQTETDPGRAGPASGSLKLRQVHLSIDILKRHVFMENTIY